MNFEPTKHYQLSGPDADTEMGRPRPRTTASSTSGPTAELYFISLFHQLRPLDIIRRDIMQQMVLCRADLVIDLVLGRSLRVGVPTRIGA